LRLKGKETWALWSREASNSPIVRSAIPDTVAQADVDRTKIGQNDLIGLAPHYTDRKSPFFTAARENARSFDLDVRTSDVRSSWKYVSL